MVLKKGVEPGGSEFSHGKGLMPPEERDYVPMEWEQHLASMQTDSTDPSAEVNYTKPSRPGATPRVRERGPAR